MLDYAILISTLEATVLFNHYIVDHHRVTLPSGYEFVLW